MPEPDKLTVIGLTAAVTLPTPSKVLSVNGPAQTVFAAVAGFGPVIRSADGEMVIARVAELLRFPVLSDKYILKVSAVVSFK